MPFKIHGPIEFDPDGIQVPQPTSVAGTPVGSGATSVDIGVAPDVHVGDWVSLVNGDTVSTPVEVIAIEDGHVAVDQPFDIPVTGNSMLAVRKIKPKLTWRAVPGGQQFGHLAWDATTKTLTADVGFHSNVHSFSQILLTVEIIDADSGATIVKHATPFSAPSGQTCRQARQSYESGLSLVVTQASVSVQLAGKNVQVRASAQAHYKARCGVAAADLSLGARLSPVFAIPS